MVGVTSYRDGRNILKVCTMSLQIK